MQIYFPFAPLPRADGISRRTLLTPMADLLIVAFDIVLAGCIAPLFAAIYFKKSVSSSRKRDG